MLGKVPPDQEAETVTTSTKLDRNDNKEEPKEEPVNIKELE